MHFGDIYGIVLFMAQTTMTHDFLRSHRISTKRTPLESWESQLSDGVRFIKIRCDLRQFTAIIIEDIFSAGRPSCDLLNREYY